MKILQDHTVTLGMGARGRPGYVLVGGRQDFSYSTQQMRRQSEPLFQVSARLWMTSSIAIDGWSGSGKTTLSKALASVLRLPAVHTGMLYRLVTAEALAFSDSVLGEGLRTVAARVVGEVKRISACVTWPEREPADLSHLWADAITSSVPRLAQNPAVREVVTTTVRAFVAREGPSIIEGRDIAAVVLPEACLKVFLDGEPEKRWARCEDSARGLRDLRDAAMLGDVCRPTPESILLNTIETRISELASILAAEYKTRLSVQSRS